MTEKQILSTTCYCLAQTVAGCSLRFVAAAQAAHHCWLWLAITFCTQVSYNVLCRVANIILDMARATPGHYTEGFSRAPPVSTPLPIAGQPFDSQAVATMSPKKQQVAPCASGQRSDRLSISNKCNKTRLPHLKRIQ